LKGTPHAKLLSSIFGGKISNEICSIDKEFPYSSETEEDFYTISLDIKGKPNIQEALDAYVKADKLEGDNAYYCEQYGKKIDATKRCCIKKLSNTLILHLKRFEFDFTTFKKVKVI
jgi:ubiquitin C-terminal hydrolase